MAGDSGLALYGSHRVCSERRGFLVTNDMCRVLTKPQGLLIEKERSWPQVPLMRQEPQSGDCQDLGARARSLRTQMILAVSGPRVPYRAPSVD